MESSVRFDKRVRMGREREDEGGGVAIGDAVID